MSALSGYFVKRRILALRYQARGLCIHEREVQLAAIKLEHRALRGSFHKLLRHHNKTKHALEEARQLLKFYSEDPSQDDDQHHRRLMAILEES